MAYPSCLEVWLQRLARLLQVLQEGADLGDPTEILRNETWTSTFAVQLLDWRRWTRTWTCQHWRDLQRQGHRDHSAEVENTFWTEINLPEEEVPPWIWDAEKVSWRIDQNLHIKVQKVNPQLACSWSRCHSNLRWWSPWKPFAWQKWPHCRVAAFGAHRHFAELGAGDGRRSIDPSVPRLQRCSTNCWTRWKRCP